MLLLWTTVALAGGPDCSKDAGCAKACSPHHARWIVAGAGLAGSGWSVVAPAIAEVNAGDRGDTALRVSGLLGAGVGAVSIGLLVAKSASPPPGSCSAPPSVAPPPPPPPADSWSAEPTTESVWTVEESPAPAPEAAPEPAPVEPEVDEVWAVEPVDEPVDPWVIEEGEEDEDAPWGPL